MRLNLKAFFLVLCYVLPLIFGHTRYSRLVPNGGRNRVTFNGDLVRGLGHPTARSRFTSSSGANQFGKDLEDAIDQVGESNAQAVWSLICNLDSDGDGILNKDELCDPNCNNAGIAVACEGDLILTHPGLSGINEEEGEGEGETNVDDDEQGVFAGNDEFLPLVVVLAILSIGMFAVLFVQFRKIKS